MENIHVIITIYDMYLNLYILKIFTSRKKIIAIIYKNIAQSKKY